MARAMIPMIGSMVATMVLAEAGLLAAGPPIVSGPMVGNVTSTTAHFWVGTGVSNQTALTLSIREAGTEALTPCDGMGSVASSDDFRSYKGVCTGLQPATAYEYKIFAGATEVAGATFMTAPDVGAHFRVGVSSCMKPTNMTEPSFTIMDDELRGDGEETLPNLQLLLGDNVYTSVKPVSREHLWNKHFTQRSVPEFARIIRHVPTFAIWDDHDYGPNDEDGSLPSDQKDTAFHAFDKLWLHPAFGAGAAINYTFMWGDVEFFMLDDRWRRDCPDGAPDGHLDRMLGTEELAWLEAGLAASTATFKVIANGSTLGSRCWHGRADTVGDGELRELYDFIVSERVAGVVFLGGDVHHVGFGLHTPEGGYPIPEVISSGIRIHARQGFATLEFDTTSADPGARSMRVRLVNGCGASTLEGAEAITVDSCSCYDLDDDGKKVCRDGGLRLDQTILRSELDFPGAGGGDDAGAAAGADGGAVGGGGGGNAAGSCAVGGGRGSGLAAGNALLLLMVLARTRSRRRR